MLNLVSTCFSVYLSSCGTDSSTHFELRAEGLYDELNTMYFIIHGLNTYAWDLCLS